MLRERGYPEWFIHAIQSHGDHTGVPRETQLEHTLYACDELSGFVQACGFVRPEGLSTLEPKSVRKKLKQPSFAKGVNRDDVTRGAEELGVDLERAHRVRDRRLAADRDRPRATRVARPPAPR